MLFLIKATLLRLFTSKATNTFVSDKRLFIQLISILLIFLALHLQNLFLIYPKYYKSLPIYS